MKIKLILLLTCFSFTLAAQKTSPAQKTKPQSQVNRFKQIPGKLGLSKSQTKAFIQAVRKHQQQRHHQNREMIQQLKVILTPEQFEKLKKMISEEG